MHLEHLTSKLSLYQCDQCSKSFKRYVKDALDLHFCSQRCVSDATKRGGAIWAKTSKTCMERFGVETPFASTDIMDKQRETCNDRYGVKNVAQIPSVKAKIKKTNLERYGAENVLGCNEVRQKVTNTMLERYGVEHPQQIASVREQTKKTNVEKYGVENTLQLPIARIHCNAPEAHNKRHATMKRNGTYKNTKPEQACYELLCRLFGADDVERQVRINNRWPIDFYVKSTDTYVQEDGVYWHGLNRPLDEIMQFKTPRDKQIYKKWLTDREQDEWFSSRGLNLVRITDVQLSDKKWNI